MRIRDSKEVNKDMMTMQTMTSRIIPVVALLAIALGVVAVAHATGAADILLPSGTKNIKIVEEVSQTNPDEVTITIWLDDQVWKKMTLPKGEYTLKTEDGQVIFETGPAQPSQEGQEQFAKAVKIAEADERVQSIISGKDYEFTAMAVTDGPEGSIAKLRLVVAGNEAYDITINLDQNVVVSIEPASDRLEMDSRT